jgi:hypothetical protein
LCEDARRAAEKQAERHEQTRKALEARQKQKPNENNESGQRNIERNVHPWTGQDIDRTGRDSGKETNTQAHALASLACGALPDGNGTDPVRQNFAGREGKKASRGSNGNGEVKIATPIPDDLQPNDRDPSYGKSGGYEGNAFNRLWVSFKSHHQSKGDLSKDWHAEFAKYLCAAIDMAAERQRARDDA